ncbi:MAG: glucosamine-6-phosphate deaminase [Oscillospiraceae bacterium]|nr:glucosamine-6-phosphate deaminase [Oscillospiraceae bacterium]
MKIQYFENYAKMSDFAAGVVADAMRSAQKNKKEKFVLGLPTGDTPVGMYSKLAEMNKSGELDFSGVVTFNLDEYYPIKKDNPQSYDKFMHDKFFGKINIDKKNANIPDGEALDAVLQCAEYEKKIESAGGIDLMVIGVGANGHIGFNEPDDFLIPDTHVAKLSENTKNQNKRFFDSVGEVPELALTMGMGSILKAKKILLLVSGESKKEVFKKFLKGEITTQVPVSFLHLHADVTVLCDIII